MPLRNQSKCPMIVLTRKILLDNRDLHVKRHALFLVTIKTAMWHANGEFWEVLALDALKTIAYQV